MSEPLLYKNNKNKHIGQNEHKNEPSAVMSAKHVHSRYILHLVQLVFLEKKMRNKHFSVLHTMQFVSLNEFTYFKRILILCKKQIRILLSGPKKSYFNCIGHIARK